MAVMFDIGTPRDRQHLSWLAVLGVRSVSTSYSSTDAQTNRPLRSVLQRPHHPAWQFPPHSRSRTRVAAPAWVTARREEQCHNPNNMVVKRVCVCVCVYEGMGLSLCCHRILYTENRNSSSDEHVARCCTPPEASAWMILPKQKETFSWLRFLYRWWDEGHFRFSRNVLHCIPAGMIHTSSCSQYSTWPQISKSKHLEPRSKELQ